MIRIIDFKCKTTLKAAAAVSALLLFAAVAAFGQQQINLTAGPNTTAMPDGTIVPMWGYSCGTAVTGSTATCAPLTGATSLAATGSLAGVYVLNGGSGYTSAPTVGFSAPTGITGVNPSTAAATAVVNGGQVVGITLTSSGAGYTAPPTITLTGGGGTGAAAVAAPAWSPVVITVPYGAAGGLQINLTNHLSFTVPGTTTTASNIPTSIVIVGQVGGGLGGAPTTTPSPSHTNAQGCPSWFIASGATPPGVPCVSQQTGSSGTPPVQGPRVQSMGTEVAAVASTTATSTTLTWPYLKPGTYLLESGTHPSIQVPMGLIGMLVVTTAPTGTGTTTAAAGTAYPGVAATATTLAVPAVRYNAEVPAEFSEIDPVQNKAVDQAVRTAGFSETEVWTRMNTGSITALTLTSAGSGYTSAPAVSISGGCATTATCGGAAATATLGYALSTLTLTNGGSGYTAAPTVSFMGGAGDGATATAALTAVVGGVKVTAGGTGYAVGNAVTFSGGGATTNAAGSVSAVSNGGVTGVTVTAGGAGYTTAPIVSFTGGGGTGATATATVVNGVVTTITVTGAGSGYTSAPTVTFTGTATTAAAATAAVSPIGAITGVTLSSGGVGYTQASPPTLAVTSTTGTGAQLAATFSVPSVTLSVGGAYTSAPTVLFTGGGGTGAAATAVLGTTSTLTVTLTSAGGGYTTAPTVSITGGGGTGAAATATISAGGCGTTHSCYPPAVNYTPFYYLINGVAFNKTNAAASVFAATSGTATNATTGVTAPVTTGITGTVLVRIVNAGLRLHVPSIVNSLTQGFNGAGAAATVSGFTLIAEDGNVLPNVQVAGVTTVPAAPRVQTDVLMVPSKVFDALVNVPAAGTTATPALPIYDRELSLSGNSSVRDAGMVAYISVNNATASNGLPVGAGTGIFAVAAANPDSYSSIVACATGATCVPLVVSDPSKGVIANDVNVYGVALSVPPTNGTLTCNALPGSPVGGICANGTFTYTPNAGTSGADTFHYCANGSSTLCTTVTLSASNLTGSPTAIPQAYTSTMGTFIKIPSPGLLLGNTDPNNLPLSIVVANVSLAACTVPVTAACGTADAAGGFTLSIPTPATPPTTVTTQTFTYVVQNSQGAKSGSGTVTVTFPPPGNLTVNVLDAQLYANCNGNSACISGLQPMTDYRWIIEEDRTFWVDPNCTTNSSVGTAGCPGVVAPGGQSTIPTFGVNFHSSTMPFVAQGCTGPLSCEYGQTIICGVAGAPACPTGTAAGSHIPAVCDVGVGACRADTGDGTSSGGFTWVNPNQVVLDPSKRYYISVLPGDAANPFPSNVSAPVCSTTGGTSTTSNCGHTMGGAPVPPACNVLGGPNACTTTSAFAPVNVLVLPTPLPTGKMSVIVFEDDFPLNGEQDGGGGNGTVAPIEPGLGGFNLVLWDTYGGLGDVTGQNTYDDFNQPLSNSLAGTTDPNTGLDACPISLNPNTVQPTPATPTSPVGPTGSGPAPASGITGMIVTCPKYESDGTTLSPLAGQAVIANLMPEKFSVQAYPGADRIARGEQWLQTNTLDGQHPHDSFIRVGEPSYFQEYGPAGYHVAIGFANPAIINARAKDVCAGAGSPGKVGSCSNTITGQVDVERISRTPDQRLYPSGSRDGLAWTQCWVSLGDPDGEDFMFTFCDAQGNFKFTGVPGGEWRLTIGDQWNDQIIDGLSTPVNVGTSGTGTVEAVCPGTGSSAGNCNMGNIGVQQWQSNLYTRTYIDANKNGIWDPGEIGIPFIYTMIHYRDGHNSNSLTTDFNGIANFNETYPLFNWYVVESDSGRYKTTGIHTVYDAGGPADGSPSCGNGTTARQCGTSTAYNFLSNTFEAVPLPADLSVPGAVYCSTADCSAEAATFQGGPSTALQSSPTASTGRIDPPWVWAEGWAGLTGLSNWIDFGKAPYAACPPACATVTVTPPGTTTATTTQVAENGGIHGYVGYASTRPFDDASQMIQQPWEPNVPNVTVNLYREGFAADGVTPTVTLVDTTTSSSWDDWAQGFYPGYVDPTSTTLLPYMNCPGQGTAVSGSANQDLFFFTLFDQPNFLNYYYSLHGGPAVNALPYNSRYKCYDSMHIGNQVQPAPYDGRYFFPSSLGINPATGTLVAAVGCVPAPAPGNVCPTASGNGVTVASMAGTNCTICVGNPDATDPYRYGTPMLPPGKYVVQVVMPPGYEVYKEEDKNLLIGDNFIAPVTQQFAGLGADIFIIPDQASVASMYEPNANGYNPYNFQDQTTSVDLQGTTLSGVPGFPGFQDPLWPCVGEQRVVPDYLSLFPQAKEVAPFAGATRPMCDRKEVTLANQMSVSAKFFIYTSTHIASKFTGGITDDFTSEFDPFSPQFGEKFSPPNMPVSTKDYLGNEISRVYSDHWGTYDGLTFSSWEVNPPNITGYSPSMMVQCMNDPGPILDTRRQIPNPANPTTFINNPTFGQMITDPLYNPAYSDFCYEDPYMPGLTTYLDTPVVPTQAFVGAGYNTPDCSYPDATPAIQEVDSQDGVGPWVSAAGHTLTITALGNVQVNNSAYSGPSASVAPFNLKTVGRHYGFGTQCTTPTATSTTCNTASSVKIGGVTAAIGTWSDTQITVTVPTGVPNCVIQQQTQYGGSTAQCGQLLITAGNGKQSIDSVTVTVGGKPPYHVTSLQTIQSAIDGAAPGDLIIVDPTCMTVATPTAPSTAATCNTGALHAATPTQTASTEAHNELLIMWLPVRLQGVGAVVSVVNASAFPAGKLLDPWRRHINCLFGLDLQGVPYTSGTNSTVSSTNKYPYDASGAYSCPDTSIPNDTWVNFNAMPNNPQIDRLPLEATIGWDATQNGNLAEQLQEPSLMGAFEGAGITVLGKGVEFHGAIPWSDGNEGGAFPAVTTLLTGVVRNPGGTPGTAGALLVGDANPYCHTGTYNTTTGAFTINSQTNPYPSNFMCNPSSIDGLTVTSSSQGGGGIFAHGWAHFLQVANNRIFNNAGTLTGGISIGQGEFPTPYIQGGTTNAAPGSCSDGTGLVTNQHQPYCLQLQVNVHNNYVTNNSSLGDELFSGTLSGGGGATFCTGNDYYLFNYNFVCGNLSAGEGGGLVHLGEIQNGDIEHNSIVFNQSQNPTIPTNGGGIMIMGTPDTDPTCGTQIDADCPPGLSDGIGHNLTINANLIQGNMAESGSGGGIRLQQVNGTDVSTFPSQPTLWNNVSITNNIIANNVAGWDGAGISLQDSLNVSIINNTIASNDSLASSGVLTQSIGTPNASAPAGNCPPVAGRTTSCSQSAGVTSTLNSSILTTTFTGLTITCPFGEANTGTGSCLGFSNPQLQNNVIWQNRTFIIGVGSLGTGTQNQQNLVSLLNASGSAAPVTPAGYTCPAGASYWDIGVRGDTGPGTHASGFTLNPTYSVLDDTGYASSNLTTNPSIVSQYCNGSRVPPTCTVTDGCGGPSGYGVPPGIVDAQTPNPVFSLTPAATVDEGNNWINVSWGPLALSNDSVTGGANNNYGGGPLFANYALNATSPAINHVPVAQPHPTMDFFGNPRPDPANTTAFDVGAVEYQPAVGPTSSASVTPTSLAFGNEPGGSTSAAQTLTVTNTGTVALGAPTLTFIGATPQPFSRPTGTAGGTCGATLAAGANCTINVVFTPPVVTTTTNVVYSRTLAIAYTGATVTGTPVALTGTGTPVGHLLFTTPVTGGTLTSVLGVPTLTFTIPTGRTAATATVTIQNNGGASLSITGETFATGSSGLFSITPTTTCTLAPAATCTLSIHYATPATSPAPAFNTGTVNVANTGALTVGGVTALNLRAQ